MNDKMNKTSICSIVALDIIDYSKKASAEQVEIKTQLDGLINLALIDIPENDRAVVTTEQGVIISCSGPLEDALEDALFISLTIRDEILKNNTQSLKPLYVQLGINLGSVHVEHKKGRLEIVGEGVEEAQRIMSFANPNQILVSRVYYEMASKVTQEISKMFEQYDMHAHDQEIYAVRLLKDQTTTNQSPNNPTPANWQLAKKINWIYVVVSLLVFGGFYYLSKWILTPIEPTITMDPPVLATPSIKPENKPTEKREKIAEPVPTAEPSQVVDTKKSEESGQPTKAAPEESKNTKVVQKKSTQQKMVETKVPASDNDKPAANNAEKPTAKAAESHPSPTVTEKSAEPKLEKKTTSHEKSGWQTFKDSVTNGSERQCTQAEIAMNQCAK